MDVLTPAGFGLNGHCANGEKERPDSLQLVMLKVIVPFSLAVCGVYCSVNIRDLGTSDLCVDIIVLE